MDYFGALPRPEDAIPIARHSAMAVMGCLLKMRTKSFGKRVLKIENTTLARSAFCAAQRQRNVNDACCRAFDFHLITIFRIMFPMTCAERKPDRFRGASSKNRSS